MAKILVYPAIFSLGGNESLSGKFIKVIGIRKVRLGKKTSRIVKFNTVFWAKE
jgi:hypothetical protein